MSQNSGRPTQFKRLISTFTIEHTSEEPDWQKIKIIHGWGSPKLEGIYYEICKNHGIEFKDFNTAKQLVKNSEQAFDYICKEVLNKMQNHLTMI